MSKSTIERARLAVWLHKEGIGPQIADQLQFGPRHPRSGDGELAPAVSRTYGCGCSVQVLPDGEVRVWHPPPDGKGWTTQLGNLNLPCPPLAAQVRFLADGWPEMSGHSTECKQAAERQEST